MTEASRSAELTRKTGETDIALKLNLDGDGAGERSTGVGFFDHMLDLFARHGHFDLSVTATGDLETGATRISNNVELLSQAIVLNYLALHNETGRLAQVLPNHGLGSSTEQDRLIAFQPIR